MEPLFLKMEIGLSRIDPGLTEKYSLKKGNLSPFTGLRIVGENGEFTLEKPKEKEPIRHNQGELARDGIVELENGIMLTTSEMLDIAQGADSPDEDA
jgi:hypothetical protein